MSHHHYDVAIIGGGIIGLAHAWRASIRGLKVAVFERTHRSMGASVRNFGMVWPLGQPQGECLKRAMRSRELWLELASNAGFYADSCGSLHLAHREDEWQVLREFVTQIAPEIDVELLDASATLKKSPGALATGLIGSLWSPNEAVVNPVETCAAVASYLMQHQVDIYFGTTINQVNEDSLQATDGRHWRVDRILVCSGDDVDTLFPDVLRHARLRKCKLHMMRTVPQPNGWRLKTHLASGLTLRHYKAFEACPSLQRLQKRVAEETPELDRYGIHVMLSQNQYGEVIVGDSHQYDADIDPFDREEIDNLILREVKKQFSLPDWTIAARWTGQYLKYTEGPFFTASPQPNVQIVTGFGGAGMTLSMATAEETLIRMFDRKPACVE